MTLRIKMVPGIDQVSQGESGIITIIRKYAQHFPKFGMELVSKDDPTFDVYASHAGTGTHNFPASVPSVSHCHGLYWTGMYPSQQWEYAANADVVKSMRQAHVITVPSYWVAETIQRDMHRNPAILPHGVDWDDWQHQETKQGYVIGYAKNRAGQDVCDPTYLNTLAPAFPNIKFVATFAPENPSPNITITGVLPYAINQKVVQQADVFVSCTRETFGIAILEAMAAGLPILGWREGGITDLVQHGINGYLARPYDYQDLIQGMAYCIQHRATLGANGRELARKWTWDNVCTQLYDVYQLAIQKAHEKPTCAVVIPSYKYADKVGSAIESAMKQTYPLLTDIVVVDDCSPDEGATERAVEKYMTDKRVKYIRLPENSGVATARNIGIGSVDTKYICPLDADDLILPQFLEACIPALERDHALGISFSSLEAVTPDGRIYDTKWPPDAPLFDQQVSGKNQVPTCCVFRKEMWESLGGYRPRYAPEGCGSEDADLWLRAGANGWGAVKASTARLFIYSLGGNTTGNRDYKEPDWRAWQPWTKDKNHPVASLASAPHGSHAARIYDTPSISVVIPVGPGHEMDVTDALDSLEAQDFRFWEAILVLDGVDEGLIAPVLKSYPYARVFRTQDGPRGAGVARNLGASHARAGLLCFLDSDDYLLPLALSRMLDEFGKEESIVYGDCQAYAIVEDPEQLEERMRKNILERNPKTGKCYIRFPAADYNCTLAQQQPSGDDPDHLYLVAHVTCLVPKAWHEAIGGFDEGMVSWEDVDWHWRLARAGYCYHRLYEDLFVYQLGAGKRREIGRKHHKQLIAYLREKYTRIPMSPCKSCGGGGGGSNPPPMKQLPSNQPAQQTVYVDEQWVECEYTHPNRGQHDVVGAATKTKYGYRSGGERFLVHKDDIASQPMYFRRLQLEQVVAPQPQVQLPPPPPAIAQPGISEPVTVPQEVTISEPTESIPRDLLADATEVIKKKVDPLEQIDVDIIPGITPAISKQMKEAGLTTPRSIMDIGIEGLQNLKGVGPNRAGAIVGYVAGLVGL